MAAFALGPLIQSKIVLPVLGDGKNSDSTNPKLKFFPVDTADKVPAMFEKLVYVWCGIWIIALLTIHENPEVKINKVSEKTDIDADS